MEYVLYDLMKHYKLAHGSWWIQKMYKKIGSRNIAKRYTTDEFKECLEALGQNRQTIWRNCKYLDSIRQRMDEQT